MNRGLLQGDHYIWGSLASKDFKNPSLALSGHKGGTSEHPSDT